MVTVASYVHAKNQLDMAHIAAQNAQTAQEDHNDNGKEIAAQLKQANKDVIVAQSGVSKVILNMKNEPVMVRVVEEMNLLAEARLSGLWTTCVFTIYPGVTVEVCTAIKNVAEAANIAEAA